jgi:hypothetical protein
MKASPRRSLAVIVSLALVAWLPIIVIVVSR